MNSFPFSPKQTVVFFPSKTNVKMSPYWQLDQQSLFVSESAPFKYLLLTAKEKSIGVDSIGDGTTNIRYPVEYYWGLIGISDE